MTKIYALGLGKKNSQKNLTVASFTLPLCLIRTVTLLHQLLVALMIVLAGGVAGPGDDLVFPYGPTEPGADKA